MAFFSDGSEGTTMDILCPTCPIGDPEHVCPVAMIQLEHNYDQCDNPQLAEAMTTLVAQEGGELRCAVLESLRSAGLDARHNYEAAETAGQQRMEVEA